MGRELGPCSEEEDDGQIPDGALVWRGRSLGRVVKLMTEKTCWLNGR